MSAINPVTTSADTASTGSGFGLIAKGQTSLGREDFLQLLVAQLQNQDPLNPQQNYEYVAQLAQFSTLEQTTTINDNLDALILQSRGMSNAQVSTMLGAEATVAGSIITLDGKGMGTTLAFALGEGSTTTTVRIQDANGNTVRTLELGPKAQGAVSLRWDGKSDAGLLQPSGSYRVSVTAKDAEGTGIDVEQRTTGTVASISYDEGYPVLHLDNGVSAPVSDLIQVAAPAPLTPEESK